MPPSPIYEEALELKHYFKKQYNSRAALNSPPHITLHMPFWWKEDKEEMLSDNLRQFAANRTPVEIQLQNFSSFPPRVIFIDVVKNEMLTNLQKELERFCKQTFNLFNANYKERPFHPHLTLAFRDLKKPAYTAAWEEFSQRQYSASFVATNFTLLKHNGKVWETFEKILLKP